MTSDQMLQWVKAIGVVACSWPVVALVLLIVFRQPLRRLLHELGSMPGSLSLKFGPAELKRDITEIVEQTQQMVTSMRQLHAGVQQDMSELEANGKQEVAVLRQLHTDAGQEMERTLAAAQRSYQQIRRLTGLMSNFYLFELEALLQAPGSDLSPEQNQRVLALRAALGDIQAEFNAGSISEQTEPAIQEANTTWVASSDLEPANFPESVDRAPQAKEHSGEVLVLLIRHGSKGQPLDVDRVAEAIKRVRQSCKCGAKGEGEWPFPQGWRWATGDCGRRARAVSDLVTPLSPEGEAQTKRLALWLCPLLSPPDPSTIAFLSSYYQHALDMSNELARQLTASGERLPVQPLLALTPLSQTETLEELLDEAEQYGIDLLQKRVVVVVGHEPRLSQLSTRLTGKRTRPFNRADVVAVAADSWVDLRTGAGRQKFRLPVADHQEEALRSKVQSKMTVATFLAGFAGALLFELLLSGKASLLHQLALFLIAAALALFVATVYMYDRLSMPEGFWVNDDRLDNPLWRPGGRHFQDDLDQQGPLYAHMVWTWQWVFTLAVGLALAGFLALVVETGNILLIAGITAALVAVWGYYALTRPRLGTD